MSSTIESTATNKVSKTYTYTIKGKQRNIKRNYEVKNPTSARNKTIQEQAKKYVEEHKQSLLEIGKRQRATTLINDLQREMEMNISYNTALKLLNECGLRD